MSLTLEQLDAYARFNGDADGWARSGERATAPDASANWALIDELLLGLAIVASGDAAPSFQDQLSARLEAEAPAPAVRARLLALADLARRAGPEGRAS